MGLSTILCLHRFILFQEIVLYVWWPSVMAEVVSVTESSTDWYSFQLRVDGPNVWCVMSTVEGCRVVNQVVFAFQQGPHWREELVEWLARLRSGRSQFSSPVSVSCDIFPSVSDMIDEDTHGRAVLSTHGFEISDLKVVVSDAGLRVFPGKDPFLALDLVLSKLKPYVILEWFCG